MADPMGTGDTTTDTAPAELSTDELLRQVIQNQEEHRAEVQQLREQVNSQRAPAPAPSATVLSDEELLKQRAEEIGQHDFYCPACGRLYNYQRECAGSPEAPHAPIDVISTDELKGGDTAQHTAAPNTDVIR